MNNAHADFCFVEKISSSKIILLEQQIGIPAICALSYTTNNNARFPLIEHLHKDKIEFIIMVDGIQKFYASKIGYTLYRGDVFVAQPNEVHLCKESKNPNNSILWFQIDLSNKENFLINDKEKADFIYQKILNFKGRKFEIESKLVNQYVEAFHLINSHNKSDKIKGQSLFIYCLLELLEQKPVLKILSDDVDYAKQYILTHIYEAIDMDELTLKSDLPFSKFKQKFKEQIGQTPREYINYIKIKHSKKTLTSSKKSITDIAYEYNFSTCKYFKTLFKRYTGYTPKKYRKLFYKK